MDILFTFCWSYSSKIELDWPAMIQHYYVQNKYQYIYVTWHIFSKH